VRSSDAAQGRGEKKARPGAAAGSRRGAGVGPLEKRKRARPGVGARIRRGAVGERAGELVSW
jgi:hypothetical protein